MTSSCANCKFLFIYLKLFVVASTNFNRMEKEYGKLSLDQFQRLVETLPEVRSQMAELPSIIKSASREKLSEILDEDFSWSDIYELPFIHGIALLFLAMGRVQKLSEVAKSEDPQAALFDWMDTEELEDWNSGEGGLFQKKHIVGLTVVMQRNILSIMLYHRTLSTLVEAVRSGDDDSLFLAVRVDRSIVACPTFADRIARAELENDKAFFLRLRSSLKGPSKKHWEAYRDLRYALFLLRDLGFDEMSDAQLEDLLVFKALRWGVDSLYLSYAGKLLPEVEARLKKLKQFAQSRDPKEQAEAQYPVGVHVFEVKDRGAGLFPYVLQDNTFRVQLRHPSHTLPMAYVQISSAYLAQAGPVKAQQALYDILAILGDIERQPTVSRIDLFVDFTSPESMEWSRHTWITRAASVNAYAVDGAFSGWAIGTKGIISARLYDKLLEIESSKKFYLKDLWRQAGWREGEPVWRLEFEFKRDALGQRGLMTLDSVMDNLSGLWSYATTEWLRLALPNPEDQTRSRWPIHPIWGYLSSIDWQSPGGPALSRHSHSRLPSGDKLFSMAFSALIGFMAREGMTDWERGKKAFVAALDAYYDEKAHQGGKPLETFTDEKVALKAREFNSILNNPEFEEERKALELKRKAEAYRKASDGE